MRRYLHTVAFYVILAATVAVAMLTKSEVGKLVSSVARVLEQEERFVITGSIKTIVTGSDGQDHEHISTQREKENYSDFLQRWKEELEEFKQLVGAQ